MGYVQTSMAEITAVDVIDLYAMSGDLGVEVWFDGGWGVDLLLGGLCLTYL